MELPSLWIQSIVQHQDTNDYTKHAKVVNRVVLSKKKMDLVHNRKYQENYWRGFKVQSGFCILDFATDFVLVVVCTRSL